MDRLNESLPLWVVTDNPSDYPGLFVARQWLAFGPTGTVLTALTLEALRAQLPRGLFCVSREVNDDPVIVEIWL